MKFLQKYSVAGLILAICFALISPFSTNAAVYSSFVDTISDSDVGASSVTHTIVASTTQAITASGTIEFVFPASFTNVAYTNLTCHTGGTATSTGTNTVGCLYPDGLEATSSTYILTGTTNPSTAGSYTISSYTRASTTTEIENSSLKVAILDDVTVSATVEPTLIFNVSGMTSTTASGGAVNGVTLTSSGSSTYDTIPFGTLTANVSSTIGQALEVTTNAAGGYTVTVAQDNDLDTGGGATINAFVDGTAATTSSQAWQSPAGTLDLEDTYGHFGLTSEDASLSANNFGTSEYKGLKNSEALEIMYHTGAADGTTPNKGYSEVAYTIEISSLQEAGDYENTLTYVCTPTY